MEILIFGKYWVKKNWFTSLFWIKCKNRELPKQFQEYKYWARISMVDKDGNDWCIFQ